ncbi:MAG: hypothetical protein LW698_14550 [Planctomycetaceae bacterium]|nr:hypothetical protein [Planctomycetaceae bacterium]
MPQRRYSHNSASTCVGTGLSPRLRAASRLSSPVVPAGIFDRVFTAGATAGLAVAGVSSRMGVDLE